MAFSCFNQGFLFVILFIQIPGIALAQEKFINGEIKSDTNESLSSASITLVDDESTIITYTISDDNGKFRLEIPAVNTPILYLKVSYMGYKEQRRLIQPNLTEYLFVLYPDETVLNEVLVKNRPVLERLGDTLRYRVMSFAKTEDRSIGDVLRRMPGIEITEDGTVYYNGEKIENLYIHGDDLMDGRYGLATKAIKKEDILNVEVMRNHQPIKVLKDKIFSDKTSINLVLKNENNVKLTTKAMIGGGFPEQYDVSITPILLNKNIKMLNILAFNNSGVDYKNDFKQLGTSNYLQNIGVKNSQITLSLGTVGAPDLPISNYYFNKSGLVDLNNIYSTKKGLQFKVNIQGFIDKNRLDYSGRVVNYTGTDTIIYKEQQALINRPQLLHSSFNVMSNNENSFFNNNLKLNITNDDNNARMAFNDNAFPQSIDKSVHEISNDFNWVPQLSGKGIGEVRWLIGYTNDRQELNIGEGYHTEVTGHEGNYEKVKQSLHSPTLFSNASVSYKIPNSVVNQLYKIGYIHEHQRLRSSLDFFEDQQTSSFSGDFGNDLKWNKQNFSLAADYQIQYKKIKSTISLPLSYQSIQYSQSEYNLDVNKKNIVFNPVLDLQYNINVEKRLSASYSYKRSFGDITDIYRGVVLRNYRTLHANNAGIQERKESTFNIDYAAEKSIILLFFNSGLVYNRITANTILSSNIENGIQKTIALPKENVQNILSLNAGLSKYVYGLSSTFSLKSQLSTHSFQQIINNQLVPFRSNNMSLSASFRKKFFEKVALTYRPNSLWSYSTLDGNTREGNKITYSTFRLNQNVKLEVTSFKAWHLELNAKHSHSSRNDQGSVQYFFVDMNLRHSIKKKGIDVNLNITNLFNVKNYRMYSTFTNQFMVNEYNLRGRMVILKLDWYF